MLGNHGRRWLFAAALVLALAFPAAAFAERWLGPLDNGTNNAGIEIDAKVNANRVPKKITQVEWHNVVSFIPCESSDHFYKVLPVENHAFEGSGHPGEKGNADWPPNPNVIETIKGTFTHHNRKIVGWIRLQGTPGRGCEGDDTGKLHFVAKR
jgi:hypothetical protein